MKWRPKCYEMGPGKLENVVLTSMIDVHLHLRCFTLHFASVFHSVISTNPAKPCCSIASSQLAFRWMCYSPRTRCVWRTTPTWMWCEQAEIKCARRVISIVAYCHSVKLLALAAQAFRSQHKKYRLTPLSFACPIYENDQRWTCTWIWIQILRHFEVMDLDVIIFP